MEKPLPASLISNSSASKRWHPKRKVGFQTSIFRGYILYMLVLGRVVFHLGLFIRRAAKKTPSFRAWTAIGLWWCTWRVVFWSAEGVELPEAQGFFVGKCIWAEDGPEMLEFLWFLLSLERRYNFTQKKHAKNSLVTILIETLPFWRFAIRVGERCPWNIYSDSLKTICAGFKTRYIGNDHPAFSRESL